ncbi:MAG TPA: DUF6520 family protein [Chitinophagaceae bacterium]|jgi:hypothetical protein
MKKYLLATFAVVLAISLSAFTKEKVSKNDGQTSFYWYQTASGTGDQSTYVNADVTFYSGPSTSAPTDVCLASSSHKCIVGFTSGQINTMTHQLNAGAQTPTNSDGRFRTTQ